MRALVKAKLRLDDIYRDAKILFDTSSSYTVMPTKKFVKLFGKKFYRLPKPKKMKLINGADIIADKYVFLDIIIDKYSFETVFVYLSDEIPETIEVEGRKMGTLDLIIGAPTMDELGIEVRRDGIAIVLGSVII